MKVALYTRVSTEDQQTSIDNQQTLFTKIIEENNWELYETYIDFGISGTKGYKRIDWKRMLQDGKDGKYNILIAKSFSRFGRNQSETLNAIKELRAVGVRIIFLEGNLDSSKDANKFGLFAWLAEQEAQQTSERLMIIWEKYNKEGIIHVCLAPYGYNYDSQLRNFVINYTESIWLKNIFDWYIEGYGFNKIASMLIKNNVPTKRGGKWAGATIKSIITNDFYLGILTQGITKTIDVTINQREKVDEKKWLKHLDNHEPLINQETFIKVQELIKTRSTKVKSSYILGGKKQSNISLFSNILVCSDCKSNMTIKRKKGLQNYKPFYTCMNYDLNGKEKCGHRSNFMWEEILIILILDELEEQLTEDGRIRKLFETKRKEIKTSNPKNELNSINKKIEQLINFTNTLTKNNLEGKITDLIFKMQMESVDKELNQLVKRKKELENIADIPLDDLEKDYINKVKSLLKADTNKWRNSMLKEIFLYIKLSVNGNIKFHYLVENKLLPK
jgi:site-specific DNA recombinase